MTSEMTETFDVLAGDLGELEPRVEPPAGIDVAALARAFGESERRNAANFQLIQERYAEVVDYVRQKRAHRERRTGAAARVNPDDIRVFYGVLAGAILLPIFTFAASFDFQRQFGAYTPLEFWWWWIIPCILELPLVVLTPMILVFRRRHESTVGPWLLAIALTAAASAINLAHAIEEMPAEPGVVHWLGAAFIASWPVLTLVTFKFFARLAVKPERPETPASPARKTATKKGNRR